MARAALLALIEINLIGLSMGQSAESSGSNGLAFRLEPSNSDAPRAQSIQQIQRELRILQTGTGDPISLSLSFELPATLLEPLLKFDFGFATNEKDAQGTFFDSFSLTLQTKDHSATALFLTADLIGVSWAPPNPQGLTLDPDTISRATIPFPNLNPVLATKYAYSVMLPVPEEFVGQSATLQLDLFDNLNNLASMAFLEDLVLGEKPQTNAAPFLLLQSSASAQGPFADEPGVEVDSVNQTLMVPQYGRDRFFRLRSDSDVKITSFQKHRDEQVIFYEFSAPVVVLQSAAKVGGPYSDEGTAQVDLASKTIALLGGSAGGFFRIRSNIRVKIARTEQVAGKFLFHFEYDPSVFGLQSSGQVTGPYADENSSVIDGARQTMTLTQARASRFYRIRSNIPRTITGIRAVADKLVISYGEPPAAVVLQSAPFVQGPYSDEMGAQIQTTVRTITVPAAGAARFYRLRSASRRKITNLMLAPGQAILRYE